MQTSSLLIAYLLISKTNCLKKLLQESQHCLNSVLNFNSNHLCTTFEILSMLDHHLTEAIQPLIPPYPTDLIYYCQSAWTLQKSYIQSILKIQNQISHHLQTHQKHLFFQLNQTLQIQQNLQQIQKFKSQWVQEHGQTLDGNL